MKYLRRQNLNTGNVFDDTVLQRVDGNIELNPSQKVIINGDLEFGPGTIIPGPEVTNVLYVTLDGDDNNSGRGEGAGQAKRTLKSALEVADQGATIYVRSGEYYEDNPLRIPPKVAIIGDNLRRTIIRPLNGPRSVNVTFGEKTDEYVTLTTNVPHDLNVGDRIRVRVQLGGNINATAIVVGNTYKIVTQGNTNFLSIGAPTNNVGQVFTATAVGSGSGTVGWVEVDETDVNIKEVPSDTTLVYRQIGGDIAPISASGQVKYAPDLFLVNSQSFLNNMVFKGLAAPAYCVNIDDDAIVDTSPYVQNCSNINGPWMKNGVEWLPFITEQPDAAGNPVTGPRPLRDDEIDPSQVHLYGIDIEGAGGGMLIDGDRYSSESPIKSMVADAFTQVAQGAIGFHITNFGYMQLVSCFSVFCNKAFFTTRGGYLSISNSVIDFGDEGFVAEGYYPDAYSSGLITNDYYSNVASVTVTPGQGYTSEPSVVIEPPTTPGGVQATAVASIDPILGIVNAITITDSGSGYDFQPTVTISGGGASIDATGIVNLQKNLFIDISKLSNKPQIGSVMFLGNDPQGYYVTDISDSSYSFKYDEQKCRRDVGIIVDAVLADMLFNSTHRSVNAGLSYLRSYSSKVTSLQKVQTIAGITQAKNDALLLTSNPIAQTRIATGFDTVINIINFGASVAPSIVNPLPPLYRPGYPESAAILLANKSFIQDEIISWLTQYTTFSYDEVKCRRDIGLILNAILGDIVLSTNYQTIVAALAYLRSYSSTVTTNQKAQTIAGLEKARDLANALITDESTKAEITAKFQIVTDIINSEDPNDAPLLVMNAPSPVETGYFNGAVQLRTNRDFIVQEVISYINENLSPGSIPGYSEAVYRRDLGYIVDAVRFDLTYGGNSATTTIANIIQSEDPQLSAAYNHLKGFIDNIILADSVGWTKSTTNGLIQETLSPAGSGFAATEAQGLVQIVIDIVDTGTTSALPEDPNYETGVNYIFKNDDREIILEDLEVIKYTTIQYLNTTYGNFSYDETTCRRDISYIVDALCYDLIYGGNTQTINAALAYKEGSVIIGEIEETQAAYEYWKSIVGNIVKNIPVDTTTPGQNTSLPLGSPLHPDFPKETAESLLQIIIDVIDNGPGYVPEEPTQPDYINGDSILLIERNTIIASTLDIQNSVINYLNNLYGGSSRVYTFPAILSVTSGTIPKMYNVSTISTGGTALEYVGSGVTYNALPFFGGEPVPAKERIERDSGKCFTVSSDQVGNYRIGEFFNVNALTGEVTIDAEKLNLSGLASIGPFRRNGVPVGVQLREVSNNANLIASNGIADPNTVPTQPAVQTYVENRYLNKVSSSAQSVTAPITFTNDIGVNGGDLYSTATTFNLLNRDGSGSIGEDGPVTVNAFLNAATTNLGHTTGTTYLNGNLEVKGQIVSSTQTSVNLLNSTVETINAFGDATTINFGDTIGTFTVKNATIDFPNASNVNINGVNPIVASTSTGTLTLFDTLITTVNAFRAATTINIGESTGTLTIGSANTVLNGDLQVKGGDLTTNQTTFNLLDTTATTVNAFGAATTLNLGAGSGTTTVENNLQVNLNTTLGVDATSSNIYWGTFTANIRDNTASSLDIKEASNSYIKIDTSNSNELTSFGSISKVAFNNVTDASSTTVASTIFAGGVGIAKKLYVGTDLNVAGNATLGDDRTVDAHVVNGTLSLNVPDNTAIAFQIKENTQTYVTAVTTNGSESVTIESIPKLLVKNTTDSSTATTGAVIVDGGVGVAKNITVGVDLGVGRDVTITGDLSVNGGDLTTTATTFNLLNTNATTVNFAGAGTSIIVGAVTGTTRVRNNLDVDGDVNIDGGDLTVSTATFNLANTTATTGNLFGVATAVNVGTSAAATSILTFGSTAQSNNEIKINSSTSGTAKITTGVTSGTAELFTSVTGTTNIASSGTINLGSSTSATTSAAVGGAISGNTLKISGTSAGTVNFTTDVTSGTANIFDSVTGNINIGAAGTTVNLGATTGNSTLVVRGNSTTGTATISTNAGVTTANVFNTEATTVNIAGAATTIEIGAATGTTNINNNLDVDGDVNIDGGDLTVSTTTFNLANTTATTGNLFGAATTVNIGVAGSAGTTTIKTDNVVLDGDLQVKGGDLTTNQTTFNLLNATASTVNFAGAATTIEIGAATGTTNVNNNLDVDGDVNIDGGDLTVSTATFNLANTTATTVNAFGAATNIGIGAAGTGGTVTIKNDNVVVDGDLQVKGGDLTTNQTTFNLLNATATTVNAFGAATSLVFAAATGTTNIRNNLDVDGDVNIDGGDLTTSASTFNLLNTTATTINVGGAATAINIGLATPTGLTTIKHDLKVDGDLSVDGTLNLGNDVTIAGDLAVNGGDLTTTATTFNLLNANAATINFAGAGTAVSIGAATGTTTINNANTVVTGDLAVNGGDITSSAVTVNILAATSTTVNAFGAATALNLGAATGTTIVRNNFEVDLNTTLNGSLTVDLGATVTGDLAVNGGDITTSSATFNLVNANATTVNFAGAATTIEIGAATGTTNINNNLDVDGDVNIDGGDLTVSTATFNLANTTATTVNFAGAGTAISIGAATGTTTINNANTVVTGDLAVNGGDITTTATGTATLFNTNATTVNIAGAGTAVNIGAATGTTNVKNNLDVDGDVNIDGGDLTVSTTTFNLANATATTVNFAGAATDIQIGAATGTTNVNNNLDVDGDVNIDGGDLTVSTTTFNLANTTATTGNLFGAATGVNVGISAASASTLTYGPAITGNTFKLAGTAVGTVNYTTDVTSGTVNAWQSVTGTVNLGKSGTINIGNSTTATTAAVVGGAFTGNSLKIAGTAAGTVTLNSDVTTGSVNLFNNITTGTLNVAGAGASIINLGSTTSTVNIGVLTLTTDLAVQYGGTGQSSFTTNGVIYGQNASGLAVTAASVPGSNATTSYGILTTDASNVPVWTDTIDGGSY